jgi:hypothetical protein
MPPLLGRISLVLFYHIPRHIHTTKDKKAMAHRVMAYGSFASFHQEKKRRSGGSASSGILKGSALKRV